MFKNIFPNNLSRLVYKGGPEAHEMASRKAEAGPAELRNEAKALANSVDFFLNQWEVNLSMGSVISPQFDRNNAKKKYGDQLGEKDAERYNDLVKARLDFLKISRDPHASRAAIDAVKTKMEGTLKIFEASRKTGDPRYNVRMERVAKAVAKPRTASEQALAKKESMEASRWSQIAELVDEFNKLGNTPRDQKRKVAIQTELVQRTKKAMEGKPNVYTMANIDVNGVMWNLRVEKARGAGTDAFRLTMVMPARRLEQGGGPGAVAVKYVEKAVYAGGSAKDFPTKRA